MNAKLPLLTGLILLAGAISSRAVVQEIVYPGYNFLTCQVQGGTANTIFDFSTFPAQASDPNGANNWLLYLWTGTGYKAPALYFNAADATTWLGTPSPAGWYDAFGYVTTLVNTGQGFIIFAANANFLGNIINLAGLDGAGPPSTYSLPQWDLRGSPTTLSAVSLAPADQWAAMVTGTAPDGVAMYVYKGKPYNPNTTPFSPQGWTVYYYHNNAWVPSGLYDNIAYPNQSIFVGLSPQVVEGTVSKGDCTGTARLANWTVELIYSNIVNGVFKGIGTNYGISDQNGNYSIIVPPSFLSGGTLTVAPEKKDANYWTQLHCGGVLFYTPPNTFNGQFSELNNFGEQPGPLIKQHVSVDVVCFPPYPYCTPCCGGTMTYVVTYVNDGNQDVYDLRLDLTLPPGVSRLGMGQIQGSENGLTGSSPPFRVFRKENYNNGTAANVGQSFYLHIPVAVVAAGCSAASHFQATAVATMQDGTLVTSSSDSLNATCLQDPNYLRVTPHGCGSEGMIPAGQELTCYIEFQNTNPAPAYDVVVSNTLSAGLDPSTVKVIGSSHPNVFQINGPQLVWVFPAIRLPSVSVDDLASRGYVKYTVKPFASDPVGTVIANQAAIYFDLDPPILTAVITNTLTADPVPVAAFNVSPRTGSAGFTNDFTYTGGTSNAMFLWDFGTDATPATSTNQNPTGVVFASGGNHLISLQVNLGDCTSDPASRVVYAGAPVLNAQPAGNQFLLYWQGDGYHLQQTAALNPETTWMASSVTNAQAGSYYSAVVPIGSGPRFYRLSQVAP